MYEVNDGFNLIYAKSGGSPKNKFFESRILLVEFLMINLNNIDFLSLNDVIIDKNKLINDNLKMSRYLKLMRIYEI
jgi:hypothetical protein